MLKITKDDILAVAEMFPTRINPGVHSVGTYYFSTKGVPGCIIGHALALAGYGPNDVTEGEGVYEFQDLFDSPKTVDWAKSVQSRADAGMTWKDSVGHSEVVNGSDT